MSRRFGSFAAGAAAVSVVLVSAIFLALMTAGCSDNGGGAGGGGEDLILPDREAWVTCENIGGGDVYCLGYVFRPDRSIRVFRQWNGGEWDTYDSGTWSVSGGKLTVTIDGYAQTGTYEVSGAQGIITFDNGAVMAAVRQNIGRTTIPPPPPQGTGGAIAGDWEQVRFRGPYENEKRFTTFNSNGQLCGGGYRRVGNIWIESVEGCDATLTWSTSGSVLTVKETYSGAVDTEIYQYSVSGNNLILVYSDDYGIDTIKFSKIDIAAFKNSLGGAVRTVVPALVGTDWQMETEDGYNIHLNLYDGRISGSNIYHSLCVNYYERMFFYTESPNRFIMLGAEETTCKTAIEEYCNSDGECYQYEDKYDCAYAILGTYEFTYTLGTSGGKRTLRLVSPALDIDHLWTGYSYDGYGGYQGAAKKARAADRPESPRRGARSWFASR